MPIQLIFKYYFSNKNTTPIIMLPTWEITQLKAPNKWHLLLVTTIYNLYVLILVVQAISKSWSICHQLMQIPSIQFGKLIELRSNQLNMMHKLLKLKYLVNQVLLIFSTMIQLTISTKLQLILVHLLLPLLIN